MEAIDERPACREADTRSALRAALAAEQEQRWADSLVLCRQALADASLLPDAFNLFGRLCWAAGDAANAIAAQRHVLLIEPQHACATADLHVALTSIRSSADAAEAFRSAVTPHPDVTCHHRDPISLLPFVGMDRLEQALHHVLQLDPSFAAAHAALGNIRARQRRLSEALNAYRLAAMLRWDWADVHLALAAFFDTVRDEPNAARHRHEALSRSQVYPARSPGAHRRVLLLAASGDPTTNAPLDYSINHERIALHRCYLTDDHRQLELPEYDLIFNAIEEAESSADAIARSAAFIASQSKPVINHPRHLGNMRRSTLPHTLRDVPGCSVPPTHRMGREALERLSQPGPATGFDFPVLVRPVDTHRGDWQERLTDVAELRDYLARVPGTHFNVSPFVDYRSKDGYYRKYRIFLVDGKPFPYHLAISDGWKVHYHSSLMEQNAWMREEEARFFDDPRSVFEGWDTVFPGIATAVGLDYFGVDCALRPDGSALIFECGAGMLMQCQDAPDLFGYKYEYVPRIFAALDDLIEHSAER